MILAVTESGTQYLINPELKTVRRSGKPLIMATSGVDPTDFEGELHYRNGVTFEIGSSMYFVYWDGTWSISTPIVSVEEIELSKEESNDRVEP
jgi:hypothetical protein